MGRRGDAVSSDGGGVSRQPHDLGPALRDGDPDDPDPRSRPTSRLEQMPVELRDGDPDDPDPRSRPTARIAPAQAPAAASKRAKPARRHRPAEKSAKRRADSRRR